jgi:hypothetical protein
MKKFIVPYLFSLIVFVVLISLYGKYIDSSTVIFGVIIMALSMIAVVLKLKKIKKKLSKIIAISITGISLILITFICHCDGTYFTKYNYFTARKDILKGKIQFVSFGNVVYSSDTIMKISRLVDSHFGYNNIVAGCHLQSREYEIAEKYYNQKMRDYLEKRNGKDWKKKSNQLFSSLYTIERDSSLSNIQKDSLITLRLKECKIDSR